MTLKDRASGILLHITSLPTAYGIGDFGPSASQFTEFLNAAGQKIWQILPLHPTATAHANSPYSSSSAFACNPLLVSPQKLADDGYIPVHELPSPPRFPSAKVDFPAVTSYKSGVLDRAWSAFLSSDDKAGFEKFCREESYWLDDFALFVVIKRLHEQRDWGSWPTPFRDREAAALDAIIKERASEIERVKFDQYLALSQWLSLKQHINGRGISVFGDIPIYVNYDSADTWSNAGLFKLRADRRPVVVAGVPPDYFSETGQLWGNPVYDWEALKADGYRWWLNRLRHVFRLYDIVRIDHFRGLVAYWEVPAHHKSAVRGKWVEAPAHDFLSTVASAFPQSALVAEDLGIITDDVREVMKQYGFPGMKILQFAFGADDPQHPYLPGNFDDNSVVYTGTHDNNTVAGWYDAEADRKVRERFEKYVGREVSMDEVPWVMIEMALRSDANLAVIPMQDVLGLGAEARMNTPATRDQNWFWRLSSEQLDNAPADKLARLVGSCRRG